MVGDRLHVHVAVLRQMRDRDQHGVFDAGEADHPGVAGADALVVRREAEQRVHQMAELPVAPADQQFRPRGGERQVRAAARLARRALAAGLRALRGMASPASRILRR